LRFTLEKLIKADRQRVFDIIANYENLDKILPKYFPSIRVRSVRENTAVVEEHLKFGNKEYIMMTKHITKYPELHEFFVIGGHAKGSHFVENYEKDGQNTKLTINVDFRLGRFENIIRRTDIKSDYNLVIDELIKIAEV
jgi:coenzyme Q-binding protein COQ10